MSDVEELDVADDVTDSDPVAEDTLALRLRYSVLKLIDDEDGSPEKARHAMLRSGNDWTRAKSSGSAVHAMTLGGAEVRVGSAPSDNVKAALSAIRAGTDVRVYPGAVRNGKEWERFSTENEGATIATAKEHEKARAILEIERSGAVLVDAQQYKAAQAMTAALKANDVASRVLFAPGAIKEQRIDWTWNGRPWRSTPDARAFRWLAELKTTRCAAPKRFLKDARRMHYHSQLAIYRHAIEQSEGWRPRDVYLFAVETVPPYAVVPYKLTERSLEHGWRKACEWHARWLECEKRNEWPGYTRGVEELDVFDPEDEAAIEVERAMANDNGERASVSF